MNIKEINSPKRFGISCIYLWTNLSNDKHYVGSAKNFYNRISAYKRGKFNPHMRAAIEKYGFDGFDISIIEIVEDENNLIQREQFWIDYYQSYNREFGYNICREAGNTLGFHHSTEAKEQMSEIRKQWHKLNPNALSGKNNPMYGKTHDEQWRKEHGDWLKQKWQSQEYQDFWHEKMSGENNPMFGVHLNGELNPMFGKTHNAETRAKISNALKGKPNFSKRKKIQCVETGEVFDSCSEVCKKLGVTNGALSVCLDKPNRTCKKLHFITLK